jgi:hypothetical protein
MFSAQIGSKTIPVNVGREGRVLQKCEQDLAISLSCVIESVLLRWNTVHTQSLPSQVIPGILFGRVLVFVRACWFLVWCVGRCIGGYEFRLKR